jgi:hypothetical protein
MPTPKRNSRARTCAACHRPCSISATLCYRCSHKAALPPPTKMVISEWRQDEFGLVRELTTVSA